MVSNDLGLLNNTTATNDYPSTTMHSTIEYTKKKTFRSKIEREPPPSRVEPPHTGGGKPRGGPGRKRNQSNRMGFQELERDALGR